VFINPKLILFFMLEVFTLHQLGICGPCLGFFQNAWLENGWGIVQKMMSSLNVMGREETYWTLILL
jgi:hypothetical protein